MFTGRLLRTVLVPVAALGEGGAGRCPCSAQCRALQGSLVVAMISATATRRSSPLLVLAASGEVSGKYLQRKDQVIGSWFWCGKLMCVHLIGISGHTFRHEAGRKRQEQLLPHTCPARDCPVVRGFLSLLLRSRVLGFTPSPSCLFMGPSQLSRKRGKQASCATAAGCPHLGAAMPRILHDLADPSSVVSPT